MPALSDDRESESRAELPLPFRVKDVAELERLLAEPTQGVIDAMRHLEGDVMLLGVAGKMGPSLARMIKHASEIAGIRRRVIGVSRFADVAHMAQLQEEGLDAIRCDLLDSQQVARLPDVANVIYLAGMKFGASKQEAQTWAMNTLLPAVICRRFFQSRIVALSTGNVYGLTPAAHGGSREADEPSPTGEYAMSCLGRERMFEYFSRTLGLPVTLIRLNYACDLRYGVLVDLALRVWQGKPIDLSTGYFNTIWQADANAMVLRSFAHASSPPLVLNITGPELLRVQDICNQFGQIMGRTPEFVGVEAPTALLSNAEQAFALFGKPSVQAHRLVAWVAEWIMRGNPTHDKPTHYESRDGKF